MGLPYLGAPRDLAYGDPRPAATPDPQMRAEGQGLGFRV